MLRKGIPISAIHSPARDLAPLLRPLLNELLATEGIQGAQEQTAKRLISEALPPVISDREASVSAFGAGERWQNGSVRGTVALTVRTKVRFLRKGIAKLVQEESTFR